MYAWDKIEKHIKEEILFLKNNLNQSPYHQNDEPNLFYGRADLGAPSINCFIEVGTINLYKLYLNLLNLGHQKIVIVPSSDYLIKFSSFNYEKNPSEKILN